MHGYSLDKARAVMARAGLDPDLAGPLAQWAQDTAAAHDGKGAPGSRRGVVVAVDGTIVARTRCTGKASTWYTIDCPAASTEVNRPLSLTYIARAVEQDVIHIRGWEVCTGQAEHKRGRGRPRTTDTRITVGLTADLLGDLDAEATARDVDRSEVIRQRLDRLRWDRQSGAAS